MIGNDYYKDLIDPMRASSTTAMAEEIKKAERVEKGRAELVANAIANGPMFGELKKQTQLNVASIVQQERQIQELKVQNAKLEVQLELLRKSEEGSKKQAKRSFVGFLISTAIALSSLIVAIVAVLI